MPYAWKMLKQPRRKLNRAALAPACARAALGRERAFESRERLDLAVAGSERAWSDRLDVLAAYALCNASEQSRCHNDNADQPRHVARVFKRHGHDCIQYNALARAQGACNMDAGAHWCRHDHMRAPNGTGLPTRPPRPACALHVIRRRKLACQTGITVVAKALLHLATTRVSSRCTHASIGSARACCALVSSQVAYAHAVT